VLTHAPWNAIPGLHHGFLDGADSAGGLWTEIVARLGAPYPVAVPRQVHGTRVLTASADGTRPEADGLAVAMPRLLVGVVTADCVPVLVVDPRRRVAAALHAGWRGASAGVLEAGIDHLRTAFGCTPGDLEAVIGPAIGGCCYEVGPEVRAAFTARTGEVTASAWSGRQLDLPAAVRCLLSAAGVGTVAACRACTSCGVGYQSYRRDGARAGRQLSFAGWA
jgi:YfiH family protein